MKKEILMLNEEGDWLKGVVCVYDRSEKGQDRDVYKNDLNDSKILHNN